MGLAVDIEAHGLGGAVGQPRAIAALRTDGGTAFVLRTDRSSWNGAFERIVRRLQAPRSQGDEARERKEGLRVTLPLPSNPDCLPLDLGEESLRPDPRLLGWGYADAAPTADVTVQGNHRQRIVFHFPDRAYVQLYERVDEEGVCMWEVRIEAKARELYADGLRGWLTRWLGYFGWLLKGDWSNPDGMARQGWVTTQWHLNSDFVGIDLGEGDQRQFLSGRKGVVYGRQATEEEEAHLFPSPDPSGNGSHVNYEFRLIGPWMQTLNIGRKTSDCCICIYRKGDQLREAKKVNPTASLYAPLWRVNGWSPEHDGDPIRVEFRLRKKGLQYVDGVDNAKVAYDFRNPVMLLDDDAVAGLWAYLTNKRRLVLSDHERKRICSTDPRWMIVQEAAGTLPPDIRQLPRRVREMTREERLAKDLKTAVGAAVQYAARFGVGAFSPEAIGDVLIAMGEAIKRGDIEVIERVIDHRLDLDAAVERARLSTDFFAHEAQAAYGELAAVMGYDPPELYTEKRPPRPPPRLELI